jgi:predicted deacylase
MIKNQQETVFTLELPYQEQTSLQRTVFEGGDGPKVAIVSGVHGDELEGLYVCHRLALWLEELCRHRPEALRGCVELYPAMNPLGLDTLQRFVPVYETDLNRNFPGDPAGLFPERIAAAAMSALAGSSLVIDIHASNIYLREIPQVRINQEFQETLVPLAQKMNLDVIWLHGAMTVLEATIAHSLNSVGIPCLVVEMGVGMRVTPEFTDQVVLGILHVWQELGVLAADLSLPERTHIPLLANDQNVHFLNADTSGLFIPLVEHWTAVKKGELLGQIISPFQGKILSEVRSTVDAVLFTLREYPLVYEGSLMARLMEVRS